VWGHVLGPELTAAGYTHWAWMDIDVILGNLGDGLSENDWVTHVVTFCPGTQGTNFGVPLTIVRNLVRLNHQLALGHPNVARFLHGANLMGKVAHYDEWGAPSNFFFRCDPEFDYAVHATKFITDNLRYKSIFKYEKVLSSTGNNTKRAHELIWLLWERDANSSTLSGKLRRNIAVAEDTVVERSENLTKWQTEYKLRESGPKGKPFSNVPDIYTANGGFSHGTLVRRNCSWYRQKVEPAAFRSGGHLIGFHLLYSKRTSYSDTASLDDGRICIAISKDRRVQLVSASKSKQCGTSDKT